MQKIIEKEVNKILEKKLETMVKQILKDMVQFGDIKITIESDYDEDGFDNKQYKE